MNKESAPGIYSYSPNDIIIYQSHLGYRVQYTILSVNLGAQGCEDFVEIESSLKYDGTIKIPISILNAAIASGYCKVYKG